MLLSKLIKEIKELGGKIFASKLEIINERELELTSITADSRAVQEGTLFIALKGAKVDGHQYIEQAIKQGAKAIVCEELPKQLNEDVSYIQSANSYEAQGYLASAWYSKPSQELKVIGITGTNGKTTIATLLYRLFLSAGYHVGLISTVCNYIGEEARPTSHTTPMPLELQKLLAEMRDKGCSHVFMEVSSHAVAQYRIAGLEFAGGVFTNLSRDHLDYHGTTAEYLKAKKAFFDNLSKNAFALTNIDDKNGEVMLQNCQAKRLSYALHSLADFKAQILEQQADYTLLEINKQEVAVRLVGHFNAYNLLAVYGVAKLLGLEEEEVLCHLSQLRSVDGRLETFKSPKKGYTAFVDYAHTPDALANVLETLDTLRQSSKGQNARIICVVGCGGDRDSGKRPLMTQEALKGSNQVILTSDNPRTEDPQAILEDMKAGIPQGEEGRVLSITDRAEAIRTACTLAREGDLVLIAGKGHETYQEINGVKHDFDDREVVKQQFETER